MSQVKVVATSTLETLTPDRIFQKMTEDSQNTKYQMFEKRQGGGIVLEGMEGSPKKRTEHYFSFLLYYTTLHYTYNYYQQHLHLPSLLSSGWGTETAFSIDDSSPCLNVFDLFSWKKKFSCIYQHTLFLDLYTLRTKKYKNIANTDHKITNISARKYSRQINREPQITTFDQNICHGF